LFYTEILVKGASLDAGDFFEVIVGSFCLQEFKFMQAKKNSNVLNWYLKSSRELNFVRICFNRQLWKSGLDSETIGVE
jgi:hypothetical protein